MHHLQCILPGHRREAKRTFAVDKSSEAVRSLQRNRQRRAKKCICSLYCLLCFFEGNDSPQGWCASDHFDASNAVQRKQTLPEVPNRHNRRAARVVEGIILIAMYPRPCCKYFQHCFAPHALGASRLFGRTSRWGCRGPEKLAEEIAGKPQGIFSKSLQEVAL